MNLDTAISTAVDAHYNQKDKGGEPYILHPLRVMLEMDTHEEMMVAIMHDVLEDNKHYTIEGLRARGFSERILQAVMALTRMKDLYTRPVHPVYFDRDITRMACYRYERECKYHDLCSTPVSQWDALFERKYKIKEEKTDD